MRSLLYVVGGLMLSGGVGFAEPEEQLEPIQVRDVRERLEQAGKLKDVIEKTEVITAQKMEKKQAKTLSQAVENELGVDATVGCSLCGMKRVQINGLKGEYTTILVDEVPLHSTVSGYYGWDALTTAGIARLEIARGAGASLLAPGALGGVIHVITQKATENRFFLDASLGNAENRSFSLVGTALNESGTRRATLSAQHTYQGPWDTDGNGVSESPRRGNYSLFGRVSQDLSKDDNLDVRLSFLRSDTLGGPTDAFTYRSALVPGAEDFQDGDVRKKYTGSPAGTMESIGVERQEGIARYTRSVSDAFQVVATASGARQTQDSFYEGNDYGNVDETFYADLRGHFSPWDAHRFSFGLDGRQERLRARSYQFFEVRGRRPDDFDFDSYGLYGQHTWSPLQNLESSFAVRLDKVRVDWRAQTAAAYEVDKWIPVPRWHVRWNHDSEWTSRFSLGQGYRVPLTFFESEHGILDRGFDIQISEVERSDSASYSLAFDNKRTTASVSGAWNRIHNLAFVSVNDLVLPKLETYGEKIDVFSADGALGYQLTKGLSLGVSYEHFFYPGQYKALLPVAAIEDRAKLLLEYEEKNWSVQATTVVVGPRDLLAYGYGDRFNVRDGAKNLSEPKGTHAPTFATLDLRGTYEFTKGMKVYGGVKNVFDYTQTKSESPLYFAKDTSYDVIHLWGPTRGREYYVGLQAEL